MPTRVALALLLTTLSVLAVTASNAAAIVDFRTPDRAAYCGTTHGPGRPHLLCWTPNDGFTVSMSPRGRATKRYEPRNRDFHDYAGGVLRFGRQLRMVDTYSCVSRRTGLTCTNAAGHGWWLGRFVGYRLF